MPTIEIPVMTVDNNTGIRSFPINSITITENTTNPLHDYDLSIEEDNGTLHEFPLSQTSFVTFKIVVSNNPPITTHSMRLLTQSLNQYGVKLTYDRQRYDEALLEPQYITEFDSLGLRVIGSDDVRMGYTAFTPVMRPGDYIGFKIPASKSADWLEIACHLPKS